MVRGIDFDCLCEFLTAFALALHGSSDKAGVSQTLSLQSPLQQRACCPRLSERPPCCRIVGQYVLQMCDCEL